VKYEYVAATEARARAFPNIDAPIGSNDTRLCLPSTRASSERVVVFTVEETGLSRCSAMSGLVSEPRPAWRVGVVDFGVRLVSDMQQLPSSASC